MNFFYSKISSVKLKMAMRPN